MHQSAQVRLPRCGRLLSRQWLLQQAGALEIVFSTYLESCKAWDWELQVDSAHQRGKFENGNGLGSVGKAFTVRRVEDMARQSRHNCLQTFGDTPCPKCWHLIAIQVSSEASWVCLWWWVNLQCIVTIYMAFLMAITSYLSRYQRDPLQWGLPKVHQYFLWLPCLCMERPWYYFLMEHALLMIQYLASG